MNSKTDPSGTKSSGLSTSASWYSSVRWYFLALFLYLGEFGGEMTWVTNFLKLAAIGLKIVDVPESLWMKMAAPEQKT